MRNQLAMAAIVLSFVAVSPAANAQPRVRPDGPAGATTVPLSPDLVYRLSCGVAVPAFVGPGPLAKPTVFLINIGTVPIPAGLRVHWTIRSPPNDGFYTFTSPLTAGQELFIPSALSFDGVIGTGPACSASFSS